MTTYAVNEVTNASTRYTGYGFDSFCKGPDGKYYGVKSDGLYLLEGPVNSEIDFGDIGFGSSVLKSIPAVYVTCLSTEKLMLKVIQSGVEYEYAARGYDDTLEAQRFDPGKGLRANYFGLKLANIDGSEMTVDTVEPLVTTLSRRI